MKKQSFILLLLATMAITFTFRCKRSTKIENTLYNTSNFRQDFEINGDSNLIRIFNKYNLGDKTLSDVREELGSPVFEFTDTLRYGVLYKDTRGYYYPYDNISSRRINSFPELIVYGYKWIIGHYKALCIYFIYDIDGELHPILCDTTDYTNSYWQPYWLFPEKDMNILDVMEIRGTPDYEYIDTIEHGLSLIAGGEDILDIRNPPLIVNKYMWVIDSCHNFVLFYPIGKNANNIKPIWGYQFDNQASVYE